MADWTIGELQLAPPLRLTADDATTEFPDLDAALAAAIAAGTSTVMRCDVLGAGPARGSAIREAIGAVLGSVIDFRPDNGLGPAVLVLADAAGRHVYAAAEPVAGARWVEIPRLAEFYALAEVDRTSQRKTWIGKLKSTKKADWPATLAPSFDRLKDLSAPALRLLLAWLGELAIPATGVDQPGKKFRGAQTHGATLPVFRYPIVEPDCYLRVISGREGWLESINAYDLGAGISLGPIQFNAQGGAVFDVLRRFESIDPALFGTCFSALDWTTGEDGGDAVLTVGSGASQVRLIGRSKDDDRNIGYLQSGVPGKSAFKDIDKSFRRALADRFRDAVVWPHIQELVLARSQKWLEPGLDKLTAAGFAPLDARRPDRDLFVLKALLLSAFVRFSASLAPLIRHLAPFATPAQKLGAIQAVLLGPPDWKELSRPRREALWERLEAQRPVAEAVWDTIERLADA
ncbi:hypothetical protein FFK22_015160 [Mycobacterium sp. KBS0706]|uniref:hypothetical protein n=1 Tax=Mycobacterium sp. KBS0706 TaxID=2578109 RepID=UPI00110F8033|nr:hypothetical protein [Mycobacterium sp. KBS0706]TSD87801.1 hypothetical protein FFK22_015160 [Mycobacterium sp. KBS0706]